jgi:hypothetical protein
MALVKPYMIVSGNTQVSTGAPGSAFVAYPSNSCYQLTIANYTGFDVEVQQDAAGVAFPVPTGTVYPFYGIQNSNQIAVRRTDQSSTPVTVKARWEG